MNVPDPDKIKRLIIAALVSDDELVDTLVLKGGNALSLAHNLKSRASFDLDFSMEGEFEPGRLAGIRDRIRRLFERTFDPEGLVVFDVVLEPKPENITSDLAEFWGGYNLEFRLIDRKRYDELEGDLPAIRREAIPSRPGGRARFEVDISRHEYCTGKQAIEIDHFTVFVYTPAMVVCEKMRAICQQTPSYARFVRKNRAARPRDFFDIYEVIQRLGVNVLDEENLDILRNMFRAKRVPVELLRKMHQERDHHRQGWDSVKDTVAPSVRLREYDFYFDFVVDVCGEIADALPPASPGGT